MISTSLYAFGPLVAFVVALVLYSIESGPIVIQRWLRLVDELKARPRHKRERDR